MLAAARWRIEPGQRQDARGRAAGALGQQLAVRAGCRGWGRKRAQDGDRHAGAAAGRVDRELGGVAQALDAAGVLAPLGQSLSPPLRFGGGKRVGRLAAATRLVLVDPRPELRRRELRERQQEVAQIAFRVNRDDRDAIDRCLFDEREAQARLAAAGHADADGVGHEVARVVEHHLVERVPACHVVAAPEIEKTELFIVLHTRMLILRLAHPQFHRHRQQRVLAPEGDDMVGVVPLGDVAVEERQAEALDFVAVEVPDGIP